MVRFVAQRSSGGDREQLGQLGRHTNLITIPQCTERIEPQALIQGEQLEPHHTGVRQNGTRTTANAWKRLIKLQQEQPEDFVIGHGAAGEGAAVHRAGGRQGGLR